ncbi:hypothetical protein [uncultured Brachyspira sp.]|uniref:hypothetical protein n=1 Tax=uncultured Brachyspira sp. TaxID=221953 RepID=UPI00262FD861|nr:hypothetical protein [uncultured Brachyspira sp.]
MLKKLLVLTLFVSFLAVGCEKLKEAAGNVTGNITGIESTYAGTWNAEDKGVSDYFYLNKMVINDDGSMTYTDVKGGKELIFESIAIVKIGETYTATYTEKNASDATVTDSYTLTIKFTSEIQATVNYTKKIGSVTTTYEDGIFNKAQ